MGKKHTHSTASAGISEVNCNLGQLILATLTHSQQHQGVTSLLLLHLPYPCRFSSNRPPQKKHAPWVFPALRQTWAKWCRTKNGLLTSQCLTCASHGWFSCVKCPEPVTTGAPSIAACLASRHAGRPALPESMTNLWQHRSKPGFAMQINQPADYPNYAAQRNRRKHNLRYFPTVFFLLPFPLQSRALAVPFVPLLYYSLPCCCMNVVVMVVTAVMLVVAVVAPWLVGIGEHLLTWGRRQETCINHLAYR